jgi:hypothetical protein
VRGRDRDEHDRRVADVIRAEREPRSKPTR